MEGFYHPEFWSGYVRPKKPGTSAKSRHAKVVSIPVHFVGSESREKQTIRTISPTAAEGKPHAAGIDVQAAALMIQRAARGFLVRKNLRVVRRLEAQVETIGKSVKGSEDRLREDAKERIRVSEALMSVLFRLDSVRGVRDYRRRVIRRAIALQETVDAIAAVDNGAGERSENPSGENDSSEDGADAEVTPETSNDSFDSGEISQDRVEDLSTDPIEESNEVAQGLPTSEAPGQSTAKEEDGERGAMDVMEKLIEENRALRGLVAGLREKNEIQTRLMSGLRERVERLEKAIEKRERHRKRQACDAKRTRAKKFERKW